MFLEDPPLYVVEPGVFAGSGLARGFAVLRDHIARLQAERAPVAVPGPARSVAAPCRRSPRRPPPRRRPVVTGRWARRTDPRPSAPCWTGPRSPPTTPTGRSIVPLVVRADAAYDAAFQPDDEHRLHRTSPHVEVVPMPGAGTTSAAIRATRDRYLDALTDFLTHQPATTLEHQR